MKVEIKANDIQPAMVQDYRYRKQYQMWLLGADPGIFFFFFF